MQAAAQEQMHLCPQPMTPHTAARQVQAPASPAPSSSAAYSMPLYSPSQGSPCGSPFASKYARSPGAAASSPRVMMRASPAISPSGAVPMSPFRGSAAGGPFLAGYQSPGAGPQSPGPRSPGFSIASLSPGGAIRHNAAVLGIPLDLRYAHDLGVPIPVRSSTGMVVAPSPVVARTGNGGVQHGGLQPQALHFGLPPLPGSAAPGQPSAAIRAIVTPLRSGVRGGA